MSFEAQHPASPTPLNSTIKLSENARFDGAGATLRRARLRRRPQAGSHGRREVAIRKTQRGGGYAVAEKPRQVGICNDAPAAVSHAPAGSASTPRPCHCGSDKPGSRQLVRLRLRLHENRLPLGHHNIP